MYYVYLIHSKRDKDRKYIGFTRDLQRRIYEHNAGGSAFTKLYAPWCLEAYFAFRAKGRALDFERYLKSHSGRAFAARRFW